MNNILNKNLDLKGKKVLLRVDLNVPMKNGAITETSRIDKIIPTIKLLLETHIFDFNEDIYGKELTVEFLTFIRTEQKFDNFEKLKEQITKDIQTARNYHKI